MVGGCFFLSGIHHQVHQGGSWTQGRALSEHSLSHSSSMALEEVRNLQASVTSAIVMSASLALQWVWDGLVHTDAWELFDTDANRSAALPTITPAPVRQDCLISM